MHIFFIDLFLTLWHFLVVSDDMKELDYILSGSSGQAKVPSQSKCHDFVFVGRSHRFLVPFFPFG